MVKIGVLALQGSVSEHLKSLSKIEGVYPCEVKNIEELKQVSGLILPGGESTTIGKLLKEFGLAEPIVERAKEGMPIWGTCAGMILMAKKIIDEDYMHLGIMDIEVRRNAYGSQLDSFCTQDYIPEITEADIPLVFIRAPWVERVDRNTKILSKINDKIVAVQQNRLLATSFHPELTNNTVFHEYFVKMVKEYLEYKSK